MRSVTTRSVFAPAVRAPAPAPTLSPAHREERHPSFRGRGSSLGRRSPGRPPSWSSPSSLQKVPGPVSFPKPGPWKRTELLSAVCGPVQSVRPIQKRPISNGLSQRGPAGQVVTVPESAAVSGRFSAASQYPPLKV